MFKFIVNQSVFLKSFARLMSISSENAIISRKNGEKILISNNIHLISIRKHIEYSLLLENFSINVVNNHDRF